MRAIFTLSTINTIMMCIALFSINAGVLPSSESHPWFQPTGYLLIVSSFVWGLVYRNELQQALSKFKYSPPVFFLGASIFPALVMWGYKEIVVDNVMLTVFMLFSSVFLVWLHIGIGVALTVSVRKIIN